MKSQNLLQAFLLVLAAFLLFPPTSPGSSVFYVSGSFFLVALLLSSLGKNLNYGIGYLQMRPGKGRLPILIGWGLLTSLAAFILTIGISVALYFLGFLDSDLVGQKVSALPPVALFLAFTLAPLGEEALFRGYLFRKISGALSSPLAGAVISSAIFASLHFMYGSIAEIAVAFIMGLVFCAATKKTGSLIPAVVAHAAYNAVSIAWMVFM